MYKQEFPNCSMLGNISKLTQIKTKLSNEN
jgi:hypothetical protein